MGNSFTVLIIKSYKLQFDKMMMHGIHFHTIWGKHFCLLKVILLISEYNFKIWHIFHKNLQDLLWHCPSKLLFTMFVREIALNQVT